MRYLCLYLFTAGLLLAGCSAAIDIKHLNNNQTMISLCVERDLILLPVEDDGAYSRMSVFVDGELYKTVSVRLARKRMDYYVPLDLSPLKGRTVEIHVDNCPYDALSWEGIKTSDNFMPDRSEYHRPAYHHTPSWGWMNDPNGMVWLDGEYHLFYQHNPYGSKWENMSWGHSVSRDLLSWENVGVALEPDHLGAIFSGSCVVDKNNTAGFGRDAMVAVYTSSGERQSQSIAYSLDKGRSFTKYDGNPVLMSELADFRDPKVLWHDESGRWIMIVAIRHAMQFFSSADLKHWNLEGSFGYGYGNHEGIWECPDLVRLPVDGDTGNTKWVLLCSVGVPDGSRVQYFTGDFDGSTFICDSDPLTVKWMDGGHDHYGASTWSNQPDGRALALAWMNNWPYANEVPTVHYRGANTVVRELSLYSADGEVYLASAPIAELDGLCQEVGQARSFTVGSEYNIKSLLPKNNGTYRVQFGISNRQAEVYGFKLFNTKGEHVDFCFNRIDGTLEVSRHHSGETSFSPLFRNSTTVKFRASQTDRLDMFVDRSSIECFINDGRTAITEIMFPGEPYDRMSFYSKGGSFEVNDFKVLNIVMNPPPAKR